MYFWKQHFCTVGKLQGFAATRLIVVTVASLDAKGCSRKLSGLLNYWTVDLRIFSPWTPQAMQ